MKKVSIQDRLPDASYFNHRLDSIVFYDVNGVKFLFKKDKVLTESKDGWLAIGFRFWLDEK